MEKRNHPFFKRFFYVQWHKFQTRRFSFRFLLLKVALFIAWLAAFLIPPLISGKIGLKLASLTAVAFVFYGIVQNYNGIRGFQRKNFTKNKIKRKILTADILDRMLNHRLSGIALSRDLGAPLLTEVLEIITNHVRALRYDNAEEKIFCSLLVEYDDKNLQVVARSKSGDRRYQPLYNKSDMLVWSAMTHKRVLASGDIFIDFPDTPSGKPYRSVLAIPIFYHDNVIAALSIDSSDPYHFSNKEEEISTRLLSYTVLLKKILIEYGIVQCSLHLKLGEKNEHNQ